MKARLGTVRAITQLRQAEAQLSRELAQVRAALAVLVPGKRSRSTAAVSGVRRRYKMSAAGREAIARAARKRWAKWRKAHGR